MPRSGCEQALRRTQVRPGRRDQPRAVSAGMVGAMRAAGDSLHGPRLCGLIVVPWRAGCGSARPCPLGEADLDPRRGSLLVRRGKGARRREVGTDDSAWEQLRPWLAARPKLAVCPPFCVITAPTPGRPGEN